MRVVIGVLSIVLALATMWVLSRDLLPPKEVRLAAGAPGGGYWTIAERYRDRLARDGIRLDIMESSGSVGNAELLRRDAADAALLQGGVEAPDGVETLGAMFVEPMFFFARRGAGLPSNPGQWAGLRLAAGGAGSGTAAAFDGLERAAGLAPGAVTRLALGGAQAAEALIAGEADIAVFVAPLGAPYLAPLFADPDVVLMRLDYMTALSRRMVQTEIITLPAAGIDLDPVVPPGDLRMLAMVAQLVARDDLHPSLVDRLVTAARDIHSGADAITPAGRFPAAEPGPLPMNAYAATLIREGPSSLQDILPYWVVAQINRFAILLLPLLFIAVPLIRALPGVYAWQMRRRVFRYYRAIRAIDIEAREAKLPDRLAELIRTLDDIDADIARLTVPPPYRDRAYTAQIHINLVRQRIEARLHRLETRTAD
ncbi:MAG: TAXI family TRAP transporter solute-binding subunit [Rhodovulum sp.]